MFLNVGSLSYPQKPERDGERRDACPWRPANMGTHITAVSIKRCVLGAELEPLQVQLTHLRRAVWNKSLITLLGRKEEELSLNK